MAMILFDRATVVRAGQVVVEQVSLEIAAGQAMAVVGRSGAGKSSLLEAAATVIPLHAGDIQVGGRSARRERAAVRRVIGYVPDRLPAWPDLRVTEFLDLFATAAGLSAKERRAAVGDGLQAAGLGAEAAARLDALPPGPAKRLLVARALLHRPAVLLLDDPLGGLDPVERSDLEALVADSHLMGRTVVAAIDDAMVPECFTHVALMVEGQVVASGPNEPGAFAPGSAWWHRIVCPGRADDAARLLASMAEVQVRDDDTIDCIPGPDAGPFSDLLGRLAEAHIPVASAAVHPSWQRQLVLRGR
jgi:ABC-type multidrug transport system ATPase subunit